RALVANRDLIEARPLDIREVRRQAGAEVRSAFFYQRLRESVIRFRYVTKVILLRRRRRDRPHHHHLASYPGPKAQMIAIDGGPVRRGHLLNPFPQRRRALLSMQQVRNQRKGCYRSYELAAFHGGLLLVLSFQLSVV